MSSSSSRITADTVLRGFVLQSPVLLFLTHAFTLLPLLCLCFHLLIASTPPCSPSLLPPPSFPSFPL